MSLPEPPSIAEYRLRLEVDTDSGAWSGQIEFERPADLVSLALDADGLDIRSVRTGTAKVPFRVRAEEQRLELDLSPVASSPIQIDFAGHVIERGLIGLYRCAQGDGTLLTTQCEPTGARRIFPCLDRPDRKARFRLTVVTGSDQEVVANAPAEAVRPRDGRTEWSFAPTLPMATYLFYLAVGRFDRAEDRSGRVPVQTLAPPGRGPTGRFAAESGARLLAAYETYYGIPYPLPKLDLIAVSELSFGAMENWGAISFRDMRVLLDPTSASFARRDVFETIAHEVAHQWFGNLVTLRRWDDIWLNESFAMLLESKITEELHPEYDAIEDFLLRAWGMGGALYGDSLRSTHPVRSRVERPEEISQIFDAISYGKGASVLRMLEGYLGPDLFRAGVTDYLERHRFGNASTEDLWAALAGRTGRSVAPLIAPWIDRPGVPVVVATLGTSGLELRQQRFSFHSTGEEEAPWPIPLRIDGDGPLRSVLFEERARTLSLDPDATVHLNPGALGFYRVRYDPVLLDRLLVALPDRPAIDRWIVLTDLAAFLQTGDVDWRTYADAVARLGATDDRLPLEGILGPLTDWALAFPSIGPVQDLARSFLANQLDRMGIARRPGEPEVRGILREEVTLARVRVDPAFARSLSEMFVEWERLDPDVRGAAALAHARADGRAGYSELLRARNRASTEAEQLRFERALAWSAELDLLAQTLDLVRTGSIRSTHAVSTLGHVAANPVGRPLLGPWLERELPPLAEQWRGSGQLSMLLERVVPWIGLERPAETREYFGRHPQPEGARGLAAGLETLELFERLRDRLTSA